MTMKFTILGCGSSVAFRVPRSAGGRVIPESQEPSAADVSPGGTGEGAGVTRVLVDTSPDLREQLLEAEVVRLDGVLFTHEHADHTHGIDDLHALFIARRRPIDVYLDEPTSKSLRARFGYCFRSTGFQSPLASNTQRCDGAPA